MNTNYQRLLDEIIAQLGSERPRLLLHSCCGPCSSYVIEYLAKHFDITVYFFNPNIHPAEEYERRKATQIELIEKLGGAVLADADYEPQEFFEAVRGLEGEREGGLRCEKCFELRLSATAREAKRGGFDYFCTTLTVSPHKNAELINAISERLADEYGVKALPSDFKKREGYKRSIELSAKYGLYRQDYCGCTYSTRNQ